MMQTFLEFFYARKSEIFEQTLQHLKITSVSLLFSILIGLFIGIAISRLKKLSHGTLGILSVIQTIPSLALLGFMLPLLGIGVFPAIVALFLYALLPIVRNTFTGISEVDPSIREAAIGMGMSDIQLLRKVELPLALPTIFAGIRTATVINVGVATLCALIAAGGLGEFIFRGISLNHPQMILAGAIPAALLAVTLDALLGWIQKNIRHFGKPVFLYSFMGLWLLFILISFLPTGRSTRILRAAFDNEFVERGDGWKALKKHYDLKNISTLEFDQGLMYQALKNGDVDLIGGYATDGRIDVYDLLVLEDDQFYFPPYYAAPLVNGKALEKYPFLAETLNLLAGKIDDRTMRKMNYAVDNHGQNPHEVAAHFLKEAGLWKKKEKSSPLAKFTIGGKKFTEQYILAEIYAQLIEIHAPLKVELKNGLGGTLIAFEALRKSEIDMYVEYTGTGLYVLLKDEKKIDSKTLRNKDKLFEYVKKQCADRFNARWMDPLGFNNTYALMMRKEQSHTWGIRKISDLNRFFND